LSLNPLVRPLLLWLGVAALAGCQIPERLANVGREPALRPIENPVEAPDYQPVRLPMPAPEPNIAAGANSLWRTGARGFFRDQRARRIGDILTVEVVIEDKADLKNETERSRDNADGLGIPHIFGFESKLADVLPDAVDPSNLVEAGSTMSNAGRGSVDREETIELQMAAVVTQVLPNGNLVVQGRQEVRVNYELREVTVAGIVRPEDITPRNSITHEKMAELRVGYGGRGQITDVQQPRYGAQVLDILLPY
jgi:flagellar L-ring protein precursor FlgH